MKILWLSWKDIKHPWAGGAERISFGLMKRLVKSGHELTLFTSTFDGCRALEKIEGVNVVRDGGRYTVYLKAFNYYRKKAKGKFDLIVDEINTIPFFSPLYVKEKRLALLYQLSRKVWFFEMPFPVSWIGYFLEPLFLRLYRKDCLVTISSSTRQDLEEAGISNIDLLPVCINFKPLLRPPVKEKKPTLLFVGRLTRGKRPDHAFEAFKLAKKEIPDLQLWIAGSGFFAEKLRNIVHKGFKFFGYLPLKKKAELMQKAHLVLVTSVREGWCLVVTEANARGTPAVGYNIPGLTESIKDGKTGSIVEPDPEAMAKEVVRILKNKKLCKKLSLNALKDSRNYTWDKTEKAFKNILSKTVKQNKT